MKKELITKRGREHKRFHRIAGISLTAVGGFWLAKKLGWLTGAAAAQGAVWPVLVILLGIMLLLSRRPACRQGTKTIWQKKGGVK